MRKITVWKDALGYSLQLKCDSGIGEETIVFETASTYSKAEADYRAVMMSRMHGCEREELPTQ